MNINFFLKFGVSILITYSLSSTFKPTGHDMILAISSPLATIASMLFGFIIASIIFFSSSADNELIQGMKSTQMYSGLISRLHFTGMGLITSCIFMVVAIFSPFKKITPSYEYTWDYIFLVFGFLALIYSLIEFWSCWKKISLVVKHM